MKKIKVPIGNHELKVTDKAQALMDTLLDLDNYDKSVKEICEIADISTATYNKYFNMPSFVEKYKQELAKNMVKDLPKVIDAFMDEAKSGSFNHGKLILEMTGMYTNKTLNQNVNTNVNITVEKADSILKQFGADYGINLDDLEVVEDDTE